MRPRNLHSNIIDTEDDESYTRLSIFEVPEDASDEEIKNWVHTEFPGEHCTHSYDCCGRYYPSRGNYVRLPYSNMICVTQQFRCNI